MILKPDGLRKVLRQLAGKEKVKSLRGIEWMDLRSAVSEHVKTFAGALHEAHAEQMDPHISYLSEVTGRLSSYLKDLKFPRRRPYNEDVKGGADALWDVMLNSTDPEKHILHDQQVTSALGDLAATITHDYVKSSEGGRAFFIKWLDHNGSYNDSIFSASSPVEEALREFGDVLKTKNVVGKQHAEIMRTLGSIAKEMGGVIKGLEHL